MAWLSFDMTRSSRALALLFYAATAPVFGIASHLFNDSGFLIDTQVHYHLFINKIIHAIARFSFFKAQLWH